MHCRLGSFDSSPQILNTLSFVIMQKIECPVAYNSRYDSELRLLHTALGRRAARLFATSAKLLCKI